MKTTLKQTKGFTLVELLVVLAIIGILALVGIPSIRNAQKASRDQGRFKQLESVQAAAAAVYSKSVTTVTLTPNGNTVTIASGTIEDSINLAPYTLDVSGSACSTSYASTGQTVKALHDATNRVLTYCNEAGRSGEKLSY